MPEDLRVVTAPLDRVAKSLTPRLRLAARVGGWPADVASKLSLGRDENGMLVPQYDGDWEEVENLEYGTEDEPPKPVFNNFFDNHLVQRAMTRETTKGMKEFVAYTQKLFS